MCSKQKALNEGDAGRDRATPASVGHDADAPLTPMSPCEDVEKDEDTFLDLWTSIVD